jgi:hypothetical protein
MAVTVDLSPYGSKSRGLTGFLLKEIQNRNEPTASIVCGQVQHDYCAGSFGHRHSFTMIDKIIDGFAEPLGQLNFRLPSIEYLFRQCYVRLPLLRVVRRKRPEH